ncbi:MFS transporter [Arthrobacter sp. NA-172]|uniref:MFS transporter n=1 Tax=Arthrobacter sp. NA-172 TaxID=3367524 RepID=UPI0037545CB0
MESSAPKAKPQPAALGNGAIVRHAGISPATTFLFAVAAAFAVANLYLAQPLLEDIAHDLRVPNEQAGLFVTVTQVGYAVGIFAVVPLGDVLKRRRLIPTMLVLAGVALLGSALAPGHALLLVALALAGVTSVSAQLLTPLAGDLAAPAQRGHVMGTIASGAMIGILLSRTISGGVAQYFGWRAIYVVAGVAAWVFAVLLWRALPSQDDRVAVPYGRLLLSVFRSVRVHRAVPITLILSALNFGVFTMFWTALTLLLSAPPFSYSVGAIGLVGLAGLAGALLARRAGRLHDRGLSVPASGAAFALVLVGLILAGLGQASIIVLLIAIVVFDIGVQATNVLSQTRLLSISATARGRMNTALITTNFIAGAIASATTALIWHAGGWTGVIIIGSAAIVLALVVWALGRRALRVSG